MLLVFGLIISCSVFRVKVGDSKSRICDVCIDWIRAMIHEGCTAKCCRVFLKFISDWKEWPTVYLGRKGMDYMACFSWIASDKLLMANLFKGGHMQITCICFLMLKSVLISWYKILSLMSACFILQSDMYDSKRDRNGCPWWWRWWD